MIEKDSGYKIRKDIDLNILVDFGFDPSPEYNEYYRYYREDEYLWVDKFSRKIDMTSPEKHCTFIRCKRIINKLIQAGLVEKENKNNGKLN